MNLPITGSELRITLVNPPFRRPVMRRFVASYFAPNFLLPPTDLLYVSAAAKRYLGSQTMVVDAIAKKFDTTATIQAVRQAQPHLVFIQLGFATIEDDLRFCDHLRRKLLTYDLDTFELKHLSKTVPKGSGYVAIGYSRLSSILIAVFENAGHSVISPDPINYSSTFQVSPCNHFVLYNPYRNSFLLSFYRGSSFFMEYDIERHSLKKISAPFDQMEFELDKNRELIYLPLPLKKEIFAYDARTRKLKKRIPTIFGARPVAYDDLHDLLIVGSLVTGEVEIINLSTNVREKKKTFAYYQRSIALDKQRRRAYIGSEKGLFYIDY